MSNCITKVPLGTIYLYQGLDQNCKPVWNYADNGSGNSNVEAGTPLRKGDSVLGSDKLTHVIDDGFIGSILDIVDTSSLDLSLVGNDLKGDVNPLWVKALLSTSPSTYINLSYNNVTGVISASLNANLLFSDYFANLQIGAFSYGSTFLTGVDGKKYTVPAQTVSYESSSKRLYISDGNFAVLPLTALELSGELGNLPTTTDAVYGSTLVLGKDNAWHKLPIVSGGGGGTDSQTLSIAGNTLSISNGNSITLPSGGGTDSQTLSIAGNTLSISNGNSITLPSGGGTDSQTLSIAGNTLSISNGNSVTLPSGGGTDSQTLSLSGNTLSISNGNSITLPSGGATTNDISSVANTITSNVNGISDTATIINSNQINISQSSVTSTVNGVTSTQGISSGVAARIAAFDSVGAFIHAPVPSGGATTNSLSLNQANGLQSVVDGVTASLPIPSGVLAKAIGYDSAGNAVYGNPSSITSSSVQLASGFITTTINGFGAAQPILTGTPVKILGFDSNDLPITVTPSSLGGGTDSQTLSLSGNTLSISNGNSVTLPSGGGTDSQTLSLAGNTLSISNGNSVSLPSGGATTNSLSLNQNTGLVSTVNGTTSTVSIPNAAIFKLMGFDAGGAPVAQTQLNTLTSANQRITSTVNGVAANLDANLGTVSTVAGWNSSGQFVSQNVSGLGGGGNTYTFNDTNSIDLVTSGTTITGNVKKSAAANNSIIENGDGIYSPSTLSDLGNPSVIPQGSFAVMGVTDVLGKDLQWRTLPTVSGGGTDSQTLSLAGNTLSISNGNSVTLPSGGATTNSLTSSNFKLISNVNGVTSDLFPPSGTLFAALGFDLSGNMVRATPNFYLNKSSRKGGPPNGATQTYSQLDLSVGTYVSGGVLPSALGGLITLNNPYGVGVDMDFIIFPEQICSLAGFDTLPSGVNSAVGSCSIDFFDTGSGTWVEYAANVVNTTVRVSPPPPSGYSATTHAHDNWKSPYRISIAGGAFAPTQIQYRTRVQVYSGILASVYIWLPVFTVIGLIA